MATDLGKSHPVRGAWIEIYDNSLGNEAIDCRIP